MITRACSVQRGEYKEKETDVFLSLVIICEAFTLQVKPKLKCVFAKESIYISWIYALTYWKTASPLSTTFPSTYAVETPNADRLLSGLLVHSVVYFILRWQERLLGLLKSTEHAVGRLLLESKAQPAALIHPHF